MPRACLCKTSIPALKITILLAMCSPTTRTQMTPWQLQAFRSPDWAALPQAKRRSSLVSETWCWMPMAHMCSSQRLIGMVLFPKWPTQPTLVLPAPWISPLRQWMMLPLLWTISIPSMKTRLGVCLYRLRVWSPMTPIRMAIHCG